MKKKRNDQLIICFTGTAPLPRKELSKLLVEKGYGISNSITKNVQLLLTDDINMNSSKLKKAKENGITIKSYQDFLASFSNLGQGRDVVS